MPHLVAASIYLSQIYSYYIRGDRSPLRYNLDLVLDSFRLVKPGPDLYLHDLGVFSFHRSQLHFAQINYLFRDLHTMEMVTNKHDTA